MMPWLKGQNILVKKSWEKEKPKDAVGKKKSEIYGRI